MQQKFRVFAGVALVAVAMACGDQSPGPASPTAGTTPVASGDNPDGSNLKATAPTPVSPTGGGRLSDERRPTLVINNSTGRFAGIGFAYRFQVTIDGATVHDVVVGQMSPDTTSWRIPTDLPVDTLVTWRARAELESAFGPWSSNATFLSPEEPEGYIRGNEVYDPLIDGKTIGIPVGSVTFIPGVGVQLNDFGSHIRYELPETLTVGEFSLLISNIPANTEGNKTKVIAMGQGHQDIVVNDRRMTVEKRGDPPGIIAWRFITREDQIDTEGPEREFFNFQGNLTYFWKATWAGVFDVRVFEGGVTGRQVYHKGKPYAGVYNPNPHFAYIGAPIGRSGPEGATVPGMIVKQVWISSQPRPEFANK